MRRWFRKHKQKIAMVIAIFIALLMGLGSLAMFFA